MSSSPVLSTIFVFALPLLLVAFWCAVVAFTAALTGWRALARRFRASSPPTGELRIGGPWFTTVYMRYWTHYGSVIRMTAAPDALYLAVLFPFRPGHPPLRIPWNEIRFGHTRRFMRNLIELTLGAGEQVPFRISEGAARRLGLLDRFDSAAQIAPAQIASPRFPSWTSRR